MRKKKRGMITPKFKSWSGMMPMPKKKSKYFFDFVFHRQKQLALKNNIRQKEMPNMVRLEITT
jgi:hypothetical protein